MLSRTLVLFLALGLAVPGVAQDRGGEAGIAAATPGPDRIAAGLDEIARTLHRLADSQTAVLAIRRVELAERRIEPLTAEVRRAREAVRSVEEELNRMKVIGDSMRDQVDAAVRQGADPLSGPMREELDHLDAMLDVERQRLETERTRLIEAENELARGRKRIEILDERLDALLEALGEE